MTGQSSARTVGGEVSIQRRRGGTRRGGIALGDKSPPNIPLETNPPSTSRRVWCCSEWLARLKLRDDTGESNGPSSHKRR